MEIFIYSKYIWQKKKRVYTHMKQKTEVLADEIKLNYHKNGLKII